ncbi:TetR/AcrR family transcriptional regulator [Paeniglutamicibacter gangotriensis]|uniref:TetR/AcrR family transcriptional regulator n=1 Tax=Paeniglutamicibacter gangotriensis TaxID=254787 RepID=A0A5B0EF05_9MICC|nr:TetR/AcrR family transcriptional regulator [Paeniglutamicibacter gangotriensis]KAA0977654.1 TetR/AcrR family transcriptional regulator [Paeniglutamicibacter gangotriensis]
MANEHLVVTARRPGRPRDTELQERILRAVNELIDDEATITVSAVVERSGVSRAAIYRRWETLDRLTAAALDVGRTVIRPPADLSIREALEYGLPAPGKIPVGEIPEGRLRQRLLLALADTNLQREYWRGHVSRRREPLLEHLERGREQGEIRADADLEATLDLLSGVFYYQVVARGESLTNAETLERCNAAMDIIWRGISAPVPED